MWQARFYQAMPRLAAEHPKARWIFLTLTVKNCQISELRDTLKHMNASWQRLKDRKEFKPVSGWIRSTEVTRGKDGTAHPHFHALLMVPPSWFTRHYIKQLAGWSFGASVYAQTTRRTWTCEPLRRRKIKMKRTRYAQPWRKR